MRKIRIFPKFYCICRFSSGFFTDSGIMFSCRVDVFMAKDVGHKVNIPGLVIEAGTIGTTELMGRDVL